MTKLGEVVAWVRDGVPIPGQIVARPDEDHYRLLLPSGATAQPFVWNCYPVGTKTPAGILLLDIDEAAIVQKQTDHLLTKQPIKEKIKLLRREHPEQIQRHGVIVTKEKPIPPKLGRGRLGAYEIPERLSDRLVPYGYSYQFMRYLTFSTDWPNWRILLLESVLEELRDQRPRQAQVYESCIIGGIPWQHPESGLVLTTPQPIEYLALDMLQYPGTIKNNLKWATAFVNKYVGDDPREYFESRVA